MLPKRVSDKGLWLRAMRSSKRPPLNSAEFNVREIAKQFLLLEDHLSDDEKYCEDCIRKHLLLVEAYAEESLTMDPNGKLAPESLRMARNARKWMIQFTDGVNKCTLAKEIRTVRKKLVETTYDPRVKR